MATGMAAREWRAQPFIERVFDNGIAGTSAIASSEKGSGPPAPPWRRATVIWRWLS